MSAYKLDTVAAAKAAYEAYHAGVPVIEGGGKVFQWEALSPEEQANWKAAATVIAETYHRLVALSEEEQKIVSDAIQYAKPLGDLTYVEAYTPNRLTVIARLAKAVGIYR